MRSAIVGLTFVLLVLGPACTDDAAGGEDEGQVADLGANGTLRWARPYLRDDDNVAADIAVSADGRLAVAGSEGVIVGGKEDVVFRFALDGGEALSAIDRNGVLDIGKDGAGGFWSSSTS